jgi:hypothetical protein
MEFGWTLTYDFLNNFPLLGIHVMPLLTQKNMLKSSLFCCLIAYALCACSTITERKNFLSNDDVKAKVLGSLGYRLGALTLLSRETEGGNT